jgi:AraC-like DNA-binding protein
MISILIVLVSGYDIIRLFDFINIDAYNITDTAIQITILTAYILTGKKLLNRKTNITNTDISSFNLVKWFNNFTNVVWITGISLIILFTLVFYKVEFLSLKFDNSSIAFLLLPLMIYWISYNALVKPELFIKLNILTIAQPAVTKYIKYQNNQLTDEEIENIIVKLNAFIVSEKGYMNPELSLDMLSKSVNIPRHHISQAINLRLNINFNDYINLQRLENVKKELLNPAKQHYTIAAIAFESGFNSISTFNEAFRKNTSMTPSEYKKSRLNT